MEQSFTRNDTNFAKGIALCLLLIHHLFYNESSQIIDIMINGRQLSNIISEYSKVCVGIFMILSGYGLYESTRAQLSVIEFYKKHIFKIYSNYWLIWIIFVPIGVCFFGRTFDIVYQGNLYSKLVINIFGFQDYFRYYGYNATWWFITAIISMYILFPLLRPLVKRYGIFAVLVSIALIFRPEIPVTLRYWIFPFILGMFASQHNIFFRLKSYKVGKYKKLSVYLIIMAILMGLRHYGPILTHVKMDGFLGFVVIALGYEYISKCVWLKNAMIFIGRHSFNIFLFHTFLFYYYFPQFYYAFKYPPLIFFFLLLSCLVVSMIVEHIKSVLGSLLISKTLKT